MVCHSRHACTGGGLVDEARDSRFGRYCTTQALYCRMVDSDTNSWTEGLVFNSTIPLSFFLPMTPIFHPQLVNGPFGDPILYIDIKFAGRALLFDLGDIQALPARKLLRLTHIFVSHTHMDHFIGFDHLLRLFVGRQKTLALFGPAGFIAQVENRLAGYTWNLVEGYDTDLTLDVTEVPPDGSARCARFRLPPDRAPSRLAGAHGRGKTPHPHAFLSTLFRRSATAAA